ncbi:hypothetical protein ACONVB_004469, partial [Escherichia coli]
QNINYSMFVCLKNLLVLPLILPADCFTSGFLALRAGYCFVFGHGVARALFAGHDGLTCTVSQALRCPFTPFVPGYP